MKRSIALLIIIVLGFIVYANSLNGGFVWDDEGLVKNNAHIRSFSFLPKIFREGIWAGAGQKENAYRPIQTLTYMIDYAVWKLDVRGYHLTNTILHIAVALCVYALIGILFGSRKLALLTGALFVVHPIHTEAVSYISGRADPLTALFMLLTFIFYVKRIKNGDCPRRGLSPFFPVPFFCLALLSKETSLILLPLIFLYHFTFRKKIEIKTISPLAGIAALYVILRAVFLRDLLLHTSSGIPPLSDRIPGIFVAITNYARLLIWPFNLHMEYGSFLFDFANPKAIIGVLIAALSLTAALKFRSKNKLISFSILWFFIALLPQSNIFPVNAYMAEHWLYIPSIGFFLIVANGMTKCRGGLSLLCILLLIFYSTLTMMQNNYWREPIGFYERTLRYAPHSARVACDLGAMYHRAGNTKKAITLYKRALQIDPNYADARHNAALIYKRN